jgi:hypothetical protein
MFITDSDSFAVMSGASVRLLFPELFFAVVGRGSIFFGSRFAATLSALFADSVM